MLLAPRIRKKGKVLLLIGGRRVIGRQNEHDTVLVQFSSFMFLYYTASLQFSQVTDLIKLFPS